VWLPVLPSGAHKPAARREAERIPDSRAMRFFDAEARVGKVYSSILHLPSGLPAWDVYLVFGPEACWEGKPPAPAYWMHQLGRAGPPELRLDGEQLQRIISSLLSRTARRTPSPSSLRLPPKSPQGGEGCGPFVFIAGGVPWFILSRRRRTSSSRYALPRR